MLSFDTKNAVLKVPTSTVTIWTRKILPQYLLYLPSTLLIRPLQVLNSRLKEQNHSENDILENKPNTSYLAFHA